MGFGEAISKQFVDALETGQDARAAMNLHNNEAGRKVSAAAPGVGSWPHPLPALSADRCAVHLADWKNEVPTEPTGHGRRLATAPGAGTPHEHDAWPAHS